MGTVTLDFSRAQPLTHDSVALDFSKAQPIDITANPHGEGTYRMVGRKGLAQVPYSNVDSARQQGYLFSGGDAGRYQKDRAADRSQSDDPSQQGFWRSVYNQTPLPILKQLAHDPAGTMVAIPEGIANELQRSGHQLKEAWNATNDTPMQTVDKTLYALPFVGQPLEHMDQQAAVGNWKGAAGTATGLVGNALLAEGAAKGAGAISPRVAKLGLLGKNPEEAYESALRPPTGVSQAGRARAVQAGLENAIPLTQKGIDKIADHINDLNQEIADTISSDPNRPISPMGAMRNLKSLRDRFSKQVNPIADVQAIDAAGQEFADQLNNGQNGPNPQRNLTATEAQTMKQGTYRALGDKAYGELKGASVEAQKALARGLKDELANQFPELRYLNAQESKLLDLQPLVERRVNQLRGQGVFRLGTGAVAGTVRALGGSNKVAAVAAVMKQVLDDPMIKSRLAIAVSKSAEIPYSRAVARVSAYSSALQSSASEPPEYSNERSPNQSTNEQP